MAFGYAFLVPRPPAVPAPVTAAALAAAPLPALATEGPSTFELVYGGVALIGALAGPVSGAGAKA